MLEINVQVHHDRWDQELSQAAELLTQAINALQQEYPEAGDENREVCFVLSNDVEVARLNEQFRGKNGPTNVLSFPTSSSAAFQAQEACEDIAPLGDVIFGLETLSKEAAAQSKTLSHHFTHLAVHGTLHLLGFDHIETHEAAKMEALERKILARIGIADPYGEVKSGNNIDDSHQ